MYNEQGFGTPYPEQYILQNMLRVLLCSIN